MMIATVIVLSKWTYKHVHYIHGAAPRLWVQVSNEIVSIYIAVSAMPSVSSLAVVVSLKIVMISK